MQNFTFLFILFLAFNLFSQTNVQVYELPGAAFNDVSVDGKYVCGVLNFSQAFVWSEATGIINLTPDNNGESFGVSNTGRVVGRRPDSNWVTANGDVVVVAGYWEIDGSWHPIGNLPGIEPFDPLFFGNATCISADGIIIGGYGAHPNWHPEAFIWSEADSFYKTMGDNQYQGTRALSLSADGQVLGGWISGPGIFWHPTIWNPDPLELGTFDPNYNNGDVYALNSDGTMAFGKAGKITNGNTLGIPMYWTDSTGLVNLIDLNSTYGGTAWGGSDDGSIIGLEVGPWGSEQGYIWTPETGPKLFTTWLSEKGITLGSNWIIRSVADISADGNVIIAWGDNTNTPDWSDGVIVILENPVPVELNSFAATANLNNVILNWTTLTETNNSGFEIERKSKLSDWVTISFIPGFGTSTEMHSYNYKDNDLKGGNYSYRLKQIDLDGTFKYSDSIKIEIIAPREFSLKQNYPNPFNPSTTIEFKIPEQAIINLSVYNMLGERVATIINDMLEGGNHKIEFNASDLASGIYLVKMSSDSFSDVIKINLLK